VNSYPRFQPVGDQAVLVEFGDRIDEQINAQVLTLAQGMSDVVGVREIVPTYCSLVLLFDPLVVSYDTLCQQIATRLNMPSITPVTRRCWRVPVCYGGDYGEDLLALASSHHLTPEQVIEQHSRADYRVYMVGFMPGFAYLGGLPKALHTPRRASPRARTPACSINIGGQQTAISSVAGPSGWHLIGRTPWQPFVPDRHPAFLFQPGDAIQFMPVTPAEFARMSDECRAPDWHPEPEVRQ
jgi:KipI family sensor histidine kinase inhibitor